ncbi:hypothetical protein CKA32_004554 [Geitlerinema sp. FC II]|nr:hypothetical protein CKA32_004554 [Geitlerinema sp. FC II]
MRNSQPDLRIQDRSVKLSKDKKSIKILTQLNFILNSRFDALAAVL